ncbi:hypothetical protein CDAR_197681 [Caerostris darwini]|uniref:Uncharacterized protein n=1 Tax=Caerostris darwini TaxID=1538125 RepID=A0AAV4VW75_9ARAC|nr:hypothetical protein CDAR_197681 [Caerostris darwini]
MIYPSKPVHHTGAHPKASRGYNHHPITPHIWKRVDQREGTLMSSFFMKRLPEPAVMTGSKEDPPPVTTLHYRAQ